MSNPQLNTMKTLLKAFFYINLIALLACDNQADNLIVSNSGTSGSITRFATMDDFMYTLNPNQLQTFDITDPSNPVLLNELETDYGLETIFIYENRIYLGARTGLYILGLEDPSNPNLLSQTLRTAQFFGGCDPVVVKDNYAYSTVKTIVNVCETVNVQSALLVYEVSDPENPILTQTFILDIPNGLAVTDQYLYVCDTGSESLRVFDISSPDDIVSTPELDYPIVDPFDIIIDDDRMIVSTLNDFNILSIDDTGAIKYVKTIAK